MRQKPRIKALRVLAAALFVVAGVGAGNPLHAQEEAVSALPSPRDMSLGGEERLHALLNRCRESQASIETMEAAFVQFKESALLLEPSESQGVFSYAAPDRVRWEYKSPDPISLLIAGEEMTTWYRDLQKVERLDVGKRSQRVLEYLGAGSSLDDLRKYFNVAMAVPDDTSKPFRLELEPRFERVAKRLRGMQIWIHPELYLPVGLRYVEADGDVTEYRFADFRINDGLPDETFTLDLPSNVEVKVLQLEGRPASR